MDDFKTYAPYCSNLPRASSFLQTKRKEPDFNEVYKVRCCRWPSPSLSGTVDSGCC